MEQKLEKGSQQKKKFILRVRLCVSDIQKGPTCRRAAAARKSAHFGRVNAGPLSNCLCYLRLFKAIFDHVNQCYLYN